MKRSLPNFLTSLLLVIAVSLLSTSAFSQTLDSDTNQDNEPDDAAPVARVARLTFVQGDVSFLRAGVTEWAPVVENLPLLAGDQLYVGRGGRAEVQLARGNYLRLSENTELTIAELSDSVAQFEITEGTVIIRTERISSAFPRFEVDTPNTAVVLKQDGLYRIDIGGENSSELIVRNGEAEASTDEGTFKVREGHRLAVDTSTEGRTELAADTTRDDWDQWSYDRDTTIDRTNVALAPDYVTNYETDNNDLYGVSDLSSYGTWTSYSSYGQCWIPRVGSDWAPYRMGQWLWIPSAGWTWLSSEPWGWAPYHYGRWAFLPGLGWAWVPGFGSPYLPYGGHRDYRWRPALVFFFNSSTPRGNYVGWYPLTPGERWRRPDRDWRGGDRNGDHGSRRPGDGGVAIQPPKHHGVTILPYEGFARVDRSARPGAPSRDVSDAINKGARAGLPEIKPSPMAIAPALSDKASRRVAVPSNEIIKRPVVTRNSDVGSTTKADVPRERRLILPRSPGTLTGGPALIDRGSDRRDTRVSPPKATASQSGSDSTGDRTPKLRPSLPPQSENVTAGEPGAERKRARDESSNAGKPKNPSGSADAAGGEKRQPRNEQMQIPAPRDGSASGNNSDARARERKSAEDTAPRPRADLPKSQDHGGSTQQAPPRQDRPRSENQSQPQPRAEQHQQKEQPQQQQQQQQEQRKKP